MICIKCGNNLIQGTKFCPYCGEKTGVYCPKCGAKENESSKFCSQCGEEISSYNSKLTEGKMVWEQNTKVPAKILENIYCIGVAILCAWSVFLFNSFLKSNISSVNETSKEVITENKEQEPEQINLKKQTKKDNVNTSDILRKSLPINLENEYILPQSSIDYLKEEELQGLDQATLRLARNEIYAKHGRKFETEDLNQYFTSKSWYHGYLSQEEFDDSVLNEYEKANLDLIKRVEGREQLSENNLQSNMDAFSAADLEGEWWDMNSKRCYMEIYPVTDGQLDITIYWSSGAYEGTIWHMDTYYDNTTGYLEYRYGEQIHYISSEAAGEQEETVYADGTGRFYLSDGYLYWVDDKENRGADCYFERENDISEETGYSNGTGNASMQTNEEWELPVSSGTDLYVVNCNASITLREAPSTTSQEVTQIPLYSSVQYIDMARDGFCKISYYGQIGYVVQSYLDVYEPQVYTGIQCMVVNCRESITLRTSISPNDKELCQIPLGATVDYIDSVADGYCLVNYNGIIGYVKEDYLAF